MAQQRERSRRSAVTTDIRVVGEAKTRFVGYEKTEVLTAISALADLGDGLFEAKLFESPFYPAGGGQVSDEGFVENEATGAAARLVEALRLEDDQGPRFEGRGFPGGGPRAPGRALGGGLPAAGDSHRD